MDMLARRILVASCVAVLGAHAGEAVPGAECPPDMPYLFSLDAGGAEGGGGGGSVLVVPIVPGQTYSVEVTVFLVNLTGEEIDTWTSRLFTACVAHDADVLSLQDVTTEGTDYGQLVGWNSVFPASSEEASGFVAADPEEFGLPARFTLGERMSLVRARYALVSPFGAERVGETVSAGIRFLDGLRTDPRLPPVENAVKLPDGRIRAPCFSDLELRFHVVADEPFVRGDANLDSRVDVSDPVSVVRTLFLAPDAPILCEDAADTNDDGRVNISDCIAAFGYLFLGGPPPAPPFPDAGRDSTPDALSCRVLR